MTHDPLCKGGDCTCTCDQLQEGHRRGCPGEDCDCLFIAEIRADEREQAAGRVAAIEPMGEPFDGGYHNGYRDALDHAEQAVTP